MTTTCRLELVRPSTQRRKLRPARKTCLITDLVHALCRSFVRLCRRCLLYNAWVVLLASSTSFDAKAKVSTCRYLLWLGNALPSLWQTRYIAASSCV